MAKFFEAWAGMTAQQAVKSAHSHRATTVQATSAGVGAVGIWGSDGGSVLRIAVERGGTTVSEGTKPAVRVNQLLKIADKAMAVYQATGLRSGDKIHAVGSDGRRYSLALPITVATQAAGTAAATMRAWADRLREDHSYKPTEPSLCPLATPYLALTKNGVAATALSDALVGGPMAAVHGLSIHTTGGGGNRDDFGTAIYGCVNTWNANYEASGFIASTHFAISWDGVIVQIVPTDRIAWAQGNPGDYNWISVEIDNDGSSKMSTTSLIAARMLFRWVCETYGVPRRIAMGTLYAKKGDGPFKKNLDKITTEVCAAGGASTTTSPLEASFARGLSCHLWLDARNLKPCPGVGILGQMAQIASPVFP
jgi:hypothetical protein